MKRLDPPKDNAVNKGNVISIVRLPPNVSTARRQMAMLNDAPAELSASIGSRFCDYEETFKFRAVFRT